MIGIINYGLGNVKSFLNIYNSLGISCKLVSNKSDFVGVDRLILPGVGSFDFAMERLTQSGLRDMLDHMVMEECKPVLGVCVGMQMMADSSEEGVRSGLGWIRGEIKKITITDYRDYPLPHMGWNTVRQIKANKIFNGIPESNSFYFLHTYYFDAFVKDRIIAKAKYPNDFPVVVNKGNIYGIQFHPEKSHNQGVLILKNFLKV